MRNINNVSITEKNKAENRPIYLYSLYKYDGTNDLHFAEHDVEVTFNGITYSPFPITHDFVSENSSGQIDTVKLRVSNVSREIQGYLENFDLRGKKVEILLVWADHLNDPSAMIKDTYYIDSYGADQNVAEFSLSGRIDVLSVELPCRKYSRTHCSWKFKSSECGYTGGETSCDKTLKRCRQLSNQLRFGGFPAIPMRRLFAI